MNPAPPGLRRAIALAGLLLVISAGWQASVAASLPLAGPVSGVSGRLLYVSVRSDNRSVFRTFTPGTKAVADLVAFPAGSYAASPAVSPDGGRVAYSAYHPGAAGSGDPGGADVFLMNVDGTHERLLAAHEAPGVSLIDTAWAPDGHALYFTRIGPDGGAQVEQILQDGSKRHVVVKEAENPTVSTKGPIAFVRTSLPSYAQTLLIVDADGRGARPLVRSSTFLTLMFPQFSPDGSRIVFAASGGPRPRPTRRSDRPGLAAAVWPAPPVAWAHGLPMDLWMINTDGTSLRPLTELGEDDPVSVWSPDGRWIAFTGALGLYLLDVGRGTVIRIHDEGGGGGLAWLSR